MRYVNTSILESIDVDKMIEDGYSMNEIYDIVDKIEELEEESCMEEYFGE